MDHSDIGNDASYSMVKQPTEHDESATSPQRLEKTTNMNEAVQPYVDYGITNSSSNRQSRFIEGDMNDSISQKPPSIFTREGSPSPKKQHQHQHQQHHHQSESKFRIGKRPRKNSLTTIFNRNHITPGTKGDSNNRDIGAGDSVKKRTEGAYGELNASRCEGTLAKRQDNYNGTSSSSPSCLLHQQSRAILPSHTDEKVSLIATPIREKPSRRDMARQAKLIKQVNNLEMKLEKAQRELQLFHEPGMGIGAPGAATPGQTASRRTSFGGGRKLLTGCLPVLLPSSSTDANDSVQDEPVDVPRVVRGRPVKHALRSASVNSDFQGGQSHDDEDAETTLHDENGIYHRQTRSTKRKASSSSPRTTSESRYPNLSADRRELSEDLTKPRRSKLPKISTDDSPWSVEEKQHRLTEQDHQQMRKQQDSSSPSTRRQQRTASMRSIASMRSSSTPTKPPPSSKMDASDETMTTSTRSGVEIHQRPQQHHRGCDHEDGLDEIPPVPPVPRRFAKAAQTAHRDSFVVRQMHMEKERTRKRDNRRRQHVVLATIEPVHGNRNGGDRPISFQWPDGCF